MIYNKLYTKKINFPKIIPYTGLSLNSSINSDYYILLEKNYFPITADISIKILNTTGINNWIKLNNIKLETYDNYYNKLNIIGNILENDTTEKNTALIEFSALNTNLNAIEQCNVLLAYIEQAPKEIIDAKIEFIPLNETQTISENTLNINGDKQFIKFYYYGLRNNAKIVNSSVILTLNDSNLNNDKLISKKITSNGIEILYELDECLTNNITYTLKCTYTSLYNITKTNTATIIQTPNVYEIKIEDIEPSETIPSIPLTNYIIKYYGKKNNEYITNDIKLKFLFHDNDPIIKYKKIFIKPYNPETNYFETVIQVYDNILPNTLKLNLQAQYTQQYNSNIKTLTQTTCNLNDITLHIIPLFYNNDENDNIILTGAEKEYQFKYYAEYNGKQYINAPAIINNITTNNYIESTVTNNIGENNFIKISDINVDSIPNYPYKLLTIKTKKNNSDDINTGTITISFLGKTKTITLNQIQNNIQINIIESDSTEQIGGLLSDINNIVIKYNVIYNGEIIIDTGQIITNIVEGNEYVDEDNIINNNEEINYIIFRCPVKTFYEDPNNTPVYIKIHFQYENVETYHIVTRYPVIYDASIFCLNQQEVEELNYYEINGNNNSTVNIAFCGIIYNSYLDHDNFIYDLNLTRNNLQVLVNSQEVSETYKYFNLDNNITKTSNYISIPGYFYVNDSGELIYIFVKLTYMKYETIIKAIEFRLSPGALDVAFYISGIGYKKDDRYIFQYNIPQYSTQFTLNPLRENVIQVCAELKSLDNILDITTQGIFDDTSIFLDSSQGRFEITSEDSFLEIREYKNYYIKPHFNTDLNDNKPIVKISYKLGLHNGQDLNIDTKYITINKTNLQSDFFLSFNNNEIITTKTINNNNQSITVYFIYTYYNETDNISYIDKDKSHYSIEINESSTIPITTQELQQSYYFDDIKNKFIYTINIPRNLQVNNQKTLKFNFKYLNIKEPYYNVKRLSDQLTIIQRGTDYDYSLNFRLSDNLNLINDIYYLDSFDLSANIYIQCKFLNEYMTNQQDNLQISMITDGIGTISYVNYNDTLHEYVYKFTCLPTASLTAKIFSININWYNKPITNPDKILYRTNGFDIIQLASGGLYINIDVQPGLTISANEQTLNITYYITSDNIIFNPYYIYDNDVSLILSGKLYNQATPSEYVDITFPEITIPNENNKFHTTYVINQNQKLNPNKLILTCTYQNTNLPDDNTSDYVIVTQQTANIELFLDLTPSIEYTGSECNILIQIYYKLNNVIYPIPNNVPLVLENKNWITLITPRYEEDNKTCYVYHINNYFVPESEYDSTIIRSCIFTYTFNNLTINKVFKQYQKNIACILNYELLNN